MQTIELIIPIFEEEKSIKIFVDQLIDLDINKNFKVCLTFVMDPGNDSSEDLLAQISLDTKNIIQIKTVLMKSRIGQANCIFVGLSLSKADAVIIIDVDLQDPIELIPFLIEKWKEGFDVILPRRRNNKFNFYLIPSQIFYFLINVFSLNQIPRNVGDFRLIDKKVVQSIVNNKPAKPFLRGDTKYRKYKSFIFDFKRKKREVGETRYANNFMRFKVALNALINYSFFFQFTLLLNISYLIIDIYMSKKILSTTFSIFLMTISLVMAILSFSIILFNYLKNKKDTKNFLIERIIN